MASLLTYRCVQCGYSISTDPQGHYALMSGECYNFSCGNCHEIVSLSANELAEMGYSPKCPECGKTGELTTWNPIYGHCPKCEAVMKWNERAGIIFAD